MALLTRPEFILVGSERTGQGAVGIDLNNESWTVNSVNMTLCGCYSEEIQAVQCVCRIGLLSLTFTTHRRHITHLTTHFNTGICYEGPCNSQYSKRAPKSVSLGTTGAEKNHVEFRMGPPVTTHEHRE